MAEADVPTSEFIGRIRWYIYLRWFLLLAIIIPGLISLYLGTGLKSERVPSLVLSVVLLATNGVFYGLSRVRRGRRYQRLLALTLLVFDVVFISYFIYSKGGIESRSQVIYALPILMGAILFGRLGVYLAAAGSAVGYDFVIAANFYGLIHSPEAVTHQATDGAYVLNTIIFFSAILLLVGALADFLTRLLVQKEQLARSTTAALERAQAIAKLGSWEWDIPTNTITWSDELYNIFGVRHGTKIDFEKFVKRIHPEDREWTEGIIKRSLKTHRPFSFENRITRSDKTQRIVHGEGKVVTDKQGRAVQMYGIAQDITSERALETAKGDFVALASHQLRTPASGVRILLAMLRDGYVDTLTPKQLTTVEQAYDANERLLRIADDLLNVAKLESGRLVLNKQHIELGLWLKNLVAPQKMLAKSQKIKLQLTMPKGTFYLYGDPERLAMVLDNLLSNARKFTGKGGAIGVALQPSAKQYKIVVEDNGSGMTRAELRSLFVKFNRLENDATKGTEGTGLGLYLAKSIVDLHGGTITVRSKPGSGSTFTISLPKVSP